MRFIPTDVGNAQETAKAVQAIAVHPHGCGERVHQDDDARVITGSSPRMWGTLFMTFLELCKKRFIPTDVGNAVKDVCTVLEITVHPHGCGERLHHIHHARLRFGSSPRMWGTHMLDVATGDYWRFIPTDVGNALSHAQGSYR